VSEIPSATATAAAAVSDLASANEELARSTEEVANAERSRGNTFTFTSSNNIDDINAEIAVLKEEQRIIKEMNEVIFGRQADFTGVNRYAVDQQQEQIQDLEAKKFMMAAENYMKNFMDGLGAGAKRLNELSAQQDRQQYPASGGIDSGQSQQTYNFYGYDRSDAADIVSRANRAARRA
jgi:hypothetical protein